MPQELTVDSREIHVVQSTILDGESYEFEFVWRPRTETWHFSVRSEDKDTPIFKRKAVQSGSNYFLNTASLEAPPGVLAVIGPDQYERVDLTNDLRLIYFSENEIQQSSPNRSYVIHQN